MIHQNPKILYICCPYSHSDPPIREHRYQTSCIAAHKLFQAGIVAINPLANSVPAVQLGGSDLPHWRWMDIDLPILRRCDEVLVLGLEDWYKSKGVRSELVEALIFEKPITLIEESDILLLPNIPKTAMRYKQSEIFKEVVDD